MFALTDCRTDPQIISSLGRLGYETIPMPPADYLQSGVASHTDMLIFIGFGKLFCHEKYYVANRELIDRIASLLGVELALSDEPIGTDYPCDVLFNACLLGTRLICNKKTVSKLIPDAAEGLGYEIINVNQGYTKCSVAVVSENAVITADKSIGSACSSLGIDVLTVCEGHISLPPYDYGFIGGASGFDNDKVYFCGSLDRHPDGDRIKEFCKKHGMAAISLCDGVLQDVGTLFLFK